MRRYSHVETAKLIRAALKFTYTRTKFSVRSESFSMGCAVRVSWTDGPTEAEVSEIYKPFEDANFDGMTDCKGYNPDCEFRGEICSFGGAWVSGSRDISATVLQMAAYRVHKETRLPLLALRLGKTWLDGGEYVVPFTYYNHDGSDVICSDAAGGYYSQLVYQVSRSIATERRSWLPELPVRLYSDVIDERVREMLR